MPNSGWPDWGHFVLKELERLNLRVSGMQEELTAIRIEIASLKAKARAWGTTAGIAAAAVIEFVLSRFR